MTEIGKTDAAQCCVTQKDMRWMRIVLGNNHGCPFTKGPSATLASQNSTKPRAGWAQLLFLRQACGKETAGAPSWRGLR